MISTIIGILLLVWLVYDLYTGRVYLHREFSYQQEPWGYCLIMLLWLVVAVSFFIWPFD